MADDGPLQPRTMFIATRGVKEYRATIPAVVRTDDVVLEIGCEWGTTTALLAPHCREVLGTDISPVCIERARERHPALRFDVLDGFDARAALDLGRPFSVVYIDMSGLSGYRALLDVVALLTMYATVLRPRAIVVKSGALKRFAAHCRPWQAPGDASVTRGARRGGDGAVGV